MAAPPIELGGHLAPVVATVGEPDRASPDPGAAKRRYYRRRDGPSRWLLVVVEIGPPVFDHADYDREGDVLYLHIGAPQDLKAKKRPKAHVLRFQQTPSASSDA